MAWCYHAPETGFKRSIDESQDHGKSSPEEIAGNMQGERCNKRVHLVQEQLSMLALERVDDASMVGAYTPRSFSHVAAPNAYGHYYETNRILHTLHMEALMRRAHHQRS